MKKILTGALLAAAVLPIVASAQFTDFDTALSTVVRWIQRIIPFILLLATLYFFWGLTKFILNAGNEEAQGQAKQIMIWGVVAVFVMVSFWGLVGFLSQTFRLDNNTVNVVNAPTGIGNVVPTI